MGKMGLMVEHCFCSASVPEFKDQIIFQWVPMTTFPEVGPGPAVDIPEAKCDSTFLQTEIYTTCVEVYRHFSSI